MIINKFVDFDKDKQVIYYNIYLNDENIITKIPIISISKKEKPIEDIIIEKLDLIEYTYTFLLNCEQR
ncbi:MAG: hypothetical protein EU529_00010 [Promethearchaeota archaeon]|nr:MAG: hypothetical protein EU529_00010 [Candidatus Lokiarchaeota archaeon]